MFRPPPPGCQEDEENAVVERKDQYPQTSLFALVSDARLSRENFTAKI